jgi:hypothetical protein
MEYSLRPPLSEVTLSVRRASSMCSRLLSGMAGHSPTFAGAALLIVSVSLSVVNQPCTAGSHRWRRATSRSRLINAAWTCDRLMRRSVRRSSTCFMSACHVVTPSGRARPTHPA